jgi:signal transduction histidine kinase
LKRSVTISSCHRVTALWALLVTLSSPFAVAFSGQPIPQAIGHVPDPSGRLAIGQLHHTAFTAENGAPQFVSSMSQDTHGFLWLVSNGILYRFDGVKFDTSLGSKLPPGLLMTVYAARSGDLWLGYLLGGLARVHEGQITFYPFGKNIPSGTPFDFRETPDGVLWVGCTNGLARFVNGTWQAADKDYGYDGRRVTQMVTTQDGALWIGGNNFALVLRPGAHRLIEIPIDQAEEEILRSPDVQWWHGGVDSGQRMRDGSGAVWVGVAQGLRRYQDIPVGDKRNQTAFDVFTTANGLSGDDVVNLYGDREGDVWVATAKGLDQFRTNRVTPILFDKAIFKPAVAFDAENTAWIGNFWEGYRIAPGSGPQAAPLLGTLVSLIAADPNGIVWFSNADGLHRILDKRAVTVPLPQGVSSTEFKNNYRAIAFGPDDTTWLSISGSGVYALKDGQWQKNGGLHGLPDDLALGMSFDRRERLWILYSDGRIALVDHGAIRIYTTSDGLTVGAASAISTSQDAIWVGGSEGIARFTGGGFASLKFADARVTKGITGLRQLQNGDLWAHGNNGLIRVSGSEISHAFGEADYAVKARVFGPQDGVIGITDKIGPLPTLALDHAGRLWVSTASNLAWINPHDVPINNVKPYPVIDALMADNLYYPVDQDAKLPVSTRNLRIAFTAASLRIPDEVHFEYKLDGMDTDWQNSQESRQVTYTNLDHGTYIFRVRAINEDGVSGDHEARLRFTIDPAFYQMRWFQLLCAALIAAAIWCFYAMRVNYLLGLFHAKAQERERIARELHDTLLQSVQGLLLLIDSASRAPPDEDIRSRLRSAVSAARMTVIEGRRSVAMLRGEDPEFDLVKGLIDYAETLSRDFDIPFYHTVEGRPCALNQHAGHELLLALREALTNAFQHAKARHIILHLNYGFWHLKVTVLDDGTGIEKDVLKEGGKSGHWGLSGIRERVKALKGRCRIDSAEGGGTAVQISIWGPRIYDRGVVHRLLRRFGAMP